MICRLRRLYLLWTLLFLGFCPQGRAVTWFPFGPDGGDARSFGADPRDPAHLYLGAANGWIYQSHDGGKTWARLALVGKRDDLVIRHILVDPSNPRHLIVGAYVVSDGGGVYVSNDAGQTWSSQPDMRGQSVRSIAFAPSNPKIVVAGTLEGVFRSTDGGEHWEQISPKGSAEIHEVESLAIDPANPQVIYAGTWHLPWRTTDGGAHWTNIKQGIITDSDVFSIIVDPRQPKTVYLSACSGIYKSVDAGLQFTGGVGVNKSQGIPSTARRTRVLLQDPENPDTVFAGTTEGLYRTFDGGKYWVQTTSDDVIVNDVYIDPMNPKHVLLATERRGVLASSDGGDSFAPSNTGFSAQQITAFTPDAGHAATVYIGVVNDKDAGGVFVSHAGGLRWSHLSDGLDGHDVLSLGQAVDGSILAGTESGIYRLTGTTWTRVGEGDASSGAPARRVEVRSELRRRAAAKTHAADVDGSVYGFALTGDTLFAASSQGLLRSASSGMTWTVVNSIPLGEWRFVAAAKSTVAVASLSEGQASRLELSSDGGNTWQPVSLPGKVGQISALAVDPQGEIWIGGRDGVYISPDKGASWGMLTDVIVRGVNNLYYDPRADRMLMTAADPSTVAFSIDVRTKQAASWDTGWNLRFLRPIGNYLVGATLFDGIVVQPRMVDSADVAKPAAIAAPADAVRQADAARH